VAENRCIRIKVNYGVPGHIFFFSEQINELSNMEN